MRIARKVYMSILTTLFILITCVATTFAWVGMFTTSTLGSFDLNIKTVNVDADYFLKISNDGINFGDTLNSFKMKREILINMGCSETAVNSVLDEGLDNYFAVNAIMEPVTTDANLSNFYSMTNLKNRDPFLRNDKRFFKFDIYLSIDTQEGIAGLSPSELNDLNINANVFFENIEDALTGTINSGFLINSNPFSTIPSNSDYECLKNINPKNLSINTKNSTRVAFQIYSPIPMANSYVGNETPVNTIIYQGGKQLPSVTNNVYDLGGILPEEYNLALKEINSIYEISVDLDTLYVDIDGDGVIQNSEKTGYLGAKNRYLNSTDLEMIEDNNVIWKSPATISGMNYLGVQNGIQTKMKVSVYFWYEGYDADCLRLVDFKPTSLNVSLCTDKNNI